MVLRQASEDLIMDDSMVLTNTVHCLCHLDHIFCYLVVGIASESGVSLIGVCKDRHWDWKCVAVSSHVQVSAGKTCLFVLVDEALLKTRGQMKVLLEIHIPPYYDVHDDGDRFYRILNSSFLLKKYRARGTVPSLAPLAYMKVRASFSGQLDQLHFAILH